MKKDTKILAKIIVIIICSLLLGGVMGYVSAVYEVSVVQMLSAVMNMVTLNSHWFIYIAGFVALASIADYTKGKAATAVALSSGDEADYEKADTLLEKALEKTNYSTIVSYIALGAMLSGFSGLYRKENILPVLTGRMVFFLILVAVTILQSVIIKQVKLLNPEKQGNILDTKFQKEWFSTCDEAERAQIGNAAYHSYLATTKAIIAAFVIISLASAVLPIGPLPIITVGIIWFVQTYTYMKHAKGNGKPL